MKQVLIFSFVLLYILVFSFTPLSNAESTRQGGGGSRTVTYTLHSGGRSAAVKTRYNLANDGRANTNVDFRNRNSIVLHANITGTNNPSAYIASQSGNSSSGITVNNFDTMSINTSAYISSRATSLNANGTNAISGTVQAGESASISSFGGNFTATSLSSKNINTTSATGSSAAAGKIFLVSTLSPHSTCTNCTKNFTDLQNAVDNVTGIGYTIFIDKGSYPGAEIDGKDNLTVSSLPNFNTSDTIITQRSGSFGILNIINSPSFTLQNLTLDGFRSSSTGIYIKNSPNTYIAGNIVKNSYTGVKVYKSDNTSITDNAIENNHIYGIQVYDSSNVSIDNNTIENNSFDGIDVSLSSNVSIDNNTIENNNYYGIKVYNSSVHANYNDIYSNGRHGLYNSLRNIDATHNWWGSGGRGADAGKPGIDGNNDIYDASGATTTYTPWSTSPNH